MNQVNNSKPETKTTPPGSREANCQICGYFVGASSVCYRCGARTKTRTSIRTVKLVALVGAILGVILLWIAAFLKQPEMINIGDITPTMNNALVIVEGRVVETVRDTEGNTFRMTLSDNTGNITINAFNQLNRFLDHFDHKLPSMGDQLRVTGTLNISQSWGTSMFLNIPQRINITERFEMKEIPIGDITVEHAGEPFTITATVSDYIRDQTRSGDPMHRITFRDNTGSISAVLWESQFEDLEEEGRKALSSPGSEIKVDVRGDVYRDQPQIALLSPADPETIEVKSIAEEPIEVERVSPLEELEVMKIGDISTAHAGRTFKITAVVEEYDLRQTRAGNPMHMITLGDDTDIITMVLWGNQFQALEEKARRAFSTSGSEIIMAVKGDEYRNRPQLDLMDPYDPRTIEVITVGGRR